MPVNISKIDAYIFEAFDDVVNQVGDAGEGVDDPFESLGPSEEESVTVPMLVRVRSLVGWDAPDGFTVQSILGNIVSGRGTLDALTALEGDKRVLSVEASRPAGTEEAVRSIDFVRANQVHSGEIAEKGDGALVAIVDGGIDVLHEAFLDKSGKSRIVEVWDQSDPSGPTPSEVYPELGADYGTLHRTEKIAEYVATQSVPGSFKQTSDGAKHGTHVASIAAGRVAGSFDGGMAPATKIVVVITQINVESGDPRSIGYSVSHTDALAYIKAVAGKLDLPVVVNVSQGMNAGAHDGTSLLEAAFDEFSGGGRDPGMAIVKSSGNERSQNGHARLTMAGNSVDELVWFAQKAEKPSKLRKDVFELWFKASDEFSFRLRCPDGDDKDFNDDDNDDWSGTVSWAEPSLLHTFKSGNMMRMHYVRYHQDNGDNRLIITIVPGAASDVVEGKWKLEVTSGRLLSRGEINAWVERNNTQPASKKGRLVRFDNHLEEETTISIPGTARTVITVGAVEAEFPARIAKFSSFGPTRDGREQPDVVAPGVQIEAANGGTTSGVRKSSGTSMAAPHVAGAVALLFSFMAKQPNTDVPNVAQVRAALTQNAQNFSGHFTPSNGYGVFDAKALLEVFR